MIRKCSSMPKFSLALVIFFIIVFVSLNFITDIDKKNVCSGRNPNSIENLNYENDDINIYREKIKLFCIVKTTPTSMENTKTLMALKLWASLCSNYRFLSLIPDKWTNRSYAVQGNAREINEPFFVLQPNGLTVETHDKLTEKVFSGIRAIYERFNSDYEWYFIVDDDAYVNMENLYLFLDDKNSSLPVTYGHHFDAVLEGGYLSGGCGYVLSREAFVRLAKTLIQPDEIECENTGVDDVDVANCLRLLDVNLASSLDEHGRERFLPLNLMDYYNGDLPDWLFEYSANTPKQGLECCSDNLIAVHYTSVNEAVKLHTAFRTQKFQTNMLNKQFGYSLSVKLKNVVENYLIIKNKLDDLIND